MILPLVLFIAAGHGVADAQHVRGGVAEAATEGWQQQRPQEERRDEVVVEPTNWRSRVLALGDYEIKEETEYSSCPEGYPSYGKLGELLTAWSPNQPDVPEEGVVERLQVLNYSDPEQLAMATTLQDCEVPFKVVGVPEAEAASKKWTDEYLQDNMQHCPHCNVMKSASNRFMFWHKKGGKPDASWEPPTRPQYMPFDKWLNWTKEAEAERIGPEDVHYYLTTGVSPSTKTPPDTGEFVADDLPFFSTSTNNFFIPDVNHQKGIQCRFGARGIIAESHFDHGKNFVLMLRGRKRYLLNPPRACPSLGIITERAHPSFRHSDIDWSDESDWPEGFADAPALETVLEAGELLYIPSFWYHYIVSEGFNVQCNARSGLSLRKQWMEETEICMGRELPGHGATPTNPHKMVDMFRHAKNKGGGGIEGMAARRERGGRGKGRGPRDRERAKGGQRPHYP